MNTIISTQSHMHMSYHMQHLQKTMQACIRFRIYLHTSPILSTSKSWCIWPCIKSCRNLCPSIIIYTLTFLSKSRLLVIPKEAATSILSCLRSPHRLPSSQRPPALCWPRSELPRAVEAVRRCWSLRQQWRWLLRSRGRSIGVTPPQRGNGGVSSRTVLGMVGLVRPTARSGMVVLAISKCWYCARAGWAARSWYQQLE